MKIMKVAAVSAVFAAQFAFAQFKQTALPYAYNALLWQRSHAAPQM